MSNFRFTTRSSVVSLYEHNGAIMNNYEIAKRPEDIPLSAVRNGMYSIRDYGFRWETHYCKAKDVWIESKLYDEPSYVEIIDWNLFPPLSEKEWDRLNVVPFKALNKNWQKYLMAHNLAKESRRGRRNNRKLLIKH